MLRLRISFESAFGTAHKLSLGCRTVRRWPHCFIHPQNVDRLIEFPEHQTTGLHLGPEHTCRARDPSAHIAPCALCDSDFCADSLDGDETIRAVRKCLSGGILVVDRNEMTTSTPRS